MEPLMSLRYAHLSHYPRPKFSGAPGDIVVHEKPAVPNTAVTPTFSGPFRLMSLPLEIRRLVYEHYCGSWEVTLDYERLTMLRSKFNVLGVPPLDLLLASKTLYHEARDIRLHTFNGRLNLNSVFILVPLRKKDRFDWLRRNVRTLHFSDSSVHPERWNRYYDNFPNLQRLEIEFPHVIGLDGRCGKLDEVLQGRHDGLLLQSLDMFRLALVDQLSEMVQVIVSQRYCLKEAVGGWKGNLVSFLVVVFLPVIGVYGISDTF